MKRIFLAFVLVLLISIPAFAWSLICDPQVGVLTYDIEANGTIVETGYVAEANGSVLYNIDHLTPGQTTFRLRAYDSSGWGSGWSDPFDATKPVKPGSARIVKDLSD